MSIIMKLQCVAAVLCFVSGVVMAGKYSREKNEQKPAGGEGKGVEFRISKLNQVWDKAIRVGAEHPLPPQCTLKGFKWGAVWRRR